MGGTESTSREQDGAVPDEGVCRLGGNLLVVEPEPLLRWSLTTYLGKWFQVFSAESRSAADPILQDHSIDAVVLSDDLGDRDADELEESVRSRNSSACVIRTVSHPSRTSEEAPATIRLEKPFELARLASFLGIPDARP